MALVNTVIEHQQRLRRCRRCPDMNGPPVTGNAVPSPVMLVGQAPGKKEVEQRRPFAWTAGKTLFGWFEQIGLDETAFRERVYMAAVCRCYPGKNPKGGDRVPATQEIINCAHWLDTELGLLHPRLIVPAGKLAIAQFMDVRRLDEVVGSRYPIHRAGVDSEIIPLPHPSGASTWHRTDPGRTLLQQALAQIAEHPAWRAICAGPPEV